MKTSFLFLSFVLFTTKLGLALLSVEDLRAWTGGRVALEGMASLCCTVYNSGRVVLPRS